MIYFEISSQEKIPFAEYLEKYNERETFIALSENLNCCTFSLDC